MSLTAVRLITDVTDPEKDGLLDGFFSQKAAPRSIFFRGDVTDVEFFPVKPSDGNAVLYWLPENVDPSHIYLGIGDADLPSESGTADLNYMGDGSSLSGVSATSTAAALQTALNGNTSIQATGQTIAVSPIGNGFFSLLWSGTGAKSLVQGDASNLVPESVVYAAWLREGNANRRAMQILQFIQRPYVYVDSWVSTSGATAKVTPLRPGGIESKAMFSVEIGPQAYAGSFSVKDSGPMAWNGQQADWQSALGSGWTVLKTGAIQFTLERASAGEYSLVDEDINVSGLSVYTGAVGTMGFNASTLFQRFLTEESASFQSTLQIRINDGVKKPTVLFIPVTLTKDILSSGALAPSNWDGAYPTSSEVKNTTLQWLAGITSLTGGGASALDGQATAGGEWDNRITLVAIAGQANIYQLVSGTDAENSPIVIRPDDYSPTNQKVWKLAL